MKILDKEFIKKQKLFLLKEKEKLEEEINQLDKFPQYGDSEEANSDEVDDYVDKKGTENKLIPLYNDVKKALKKIDEKKYGYCEKCNKEINIERLKAFPAAVTCIKCDTI